MDLTRRQITEIHKALCVFDGTPQTPMKLTAEVRYSMAKNIRILKGLVRDIGKARDALIRSMSQSGSIPQDSPLFEVFDKQWTEFLDATESVPNLMRFTLADLNIDVNQPPPSALADLGPIIIESEKK